jgi:molecular chaperone HscB
MSTNTAHNYFELFGLTPAFNIDAATLEMRFRKIQSESHPDRFVTAPAAEKLKSMQLATLANEAYQTLKHPATRAKYLLELQGITAISETNTAMPADFLMQQMEWREVLEDAKAAQNIDALDDLLGEIKTEASVLKTELISLLDQEHDYDAATSSTRKLIFMDKVSADINKVIAQIEN